MVERVPRKRRVLPTPGRQHESSIGAERSTLFGPAPLLVGENAADREEFLQEVTAAVKPIDILEKIWVRDFVNHDSDAGLLRQLKAKLINDAARDLLKDEICRCAMKEAEDTADSSFEDDSSALLAEGDIEPDRSEIEGEVDRKEQAANGLARRWRAGDLGAKNKLRKIFAAAGRDIEEVIADVLATAVINTMQDAEWIDRKIMTEESRRNGVVRELDRHRAIVGFQLRRPSEQIHDAEYKVIEDAKIKDRRA